MITTEEISVRVYQLLQNSEVKDMISGSIRYKRHDYDKEDVIIVPHGITGEDSIRFGQININIHVPDLVMQGKNPTYEIDFPRLIDIRAKVIEVLSNHYELGKGYNWTIGFLNPPLKEPDHNEHFVTLILELTVRNKKTN